MTHAPSKRKPAFVLDMVHHNPGEAPFETAFSDSSHLREYGYNGKVFKHINCIATFAATGVDCFPKGTPAHEWLEEFTAQIESEMNDALQARVAAFSHIDLFVLPKVLVDCFRKRLCDRNGRISIDNEFTPEIHRLLFNELFSRYPRLDGLVVRHGETYLYDTPFHTGNGPVAWHAPLAEPERDQDRFTRLISFLREEICVKHKKTLIFRTWDYLPDRFHANPDYYRTITDAIPPHPKLLFSIKHTRLDFFRRVDANAALGIGRHSQIIEVQCQREYEGKGAYPNYVAKGVIEGFPENTPPTGLADLLEHPLIRGVWTWSRGGGWYGPYVINELWCDLNAYVVAGYAAGRGTEPELFLRYAETYLGLNNKDAERFRELCKLSSEAVLKGRYCEAYDEPLEGKQVPVNLWMRDDRLGGATRLDVIFSALRESDRISVALAEKDESVVLWKRISQLSREIQFPSESVQQFVRVSCDYGLLLFSRVALGWRAISMCDHVSANSYWAARREYRALADSPFCPSLYIGRDFWMPGDVPGPGLDAAVSAISAPDDQQID